MVNESHVTTDLKCECCGRPEVDPDLYSRGEVLCKTCHDYVLAVEKYNCTYSSKLI